MAKGKWDSTLEFVRMVNRLVARAGRRVGMADMAEFDELLELRASLDEALAAAMAGLRHTGYSWAELGEHMGVTGQAVNMRFGPRVREIMEAMQAEAEAG